MLDTVFQGQYLTNLSIHYVTINKDLEKISPQLHYDRGCNDFRVVIATK